MRTLPRDPDPELSTSRREGWKQEVEIVLISPLFGGGARTRKLDERSWLRPSALKSALRFWWRAGHAHRFADLASLRAAEEHLFGCAAGFGSKGSLRGGPGQVSVEVENAQRQGLSPSPFEPKEGAAVNITYFGAAEQRGRGIDAAELGRPSKSAKARLRIRLAHEAAPEDEEQVLAALRLWLTLGGVGSRTRRGAGAVAVSKLAGFETLGLAITAEALRAQLKAWLHPPAAEDAITGLWDLAHSQAVFLGKPLDSAEGAQERLLEVLREFRQKRRHPRSWQGAAGWGQSQWPEADALRLRVGVAPDWRHQPDEAHKESFPRAALGLPIVMHFKDEGRGKDPADHSISAARPSGGGWSRLNRFASPLLLRPVQVWERDKAVFVPVAWLGPYTLPTEARPLVEPTAGGTPTAIDPRHVASDFDLGAKASNLYTDLIAAFTRANGFTRIS